jgi:NAD+ synthetase
MNVQFNMKKITDYSKVFWTLVKRTEDYICSNNLKCMVLGISGGIDSTVVAAICHEVSKRTGVPLIGRSLPTKHNKEGEKSAALMVGKAFCNDFKEVSIKYPYDAYLDFLEGVDEDINPIADGNIQARLRMIYLYNLASVYRGLVMDTDNLTENNLGYFTIHGDVGDFNPIGGLWKTEVFALASYIRGYYHFEAQVHSNPKLIEEASNKAIAIEESLKLKPTAGLGITDSDLDEIGADSYEQVDYILQEILAWKKFKLNQGFYAFSHEMTCDDFLEDQQMLDTPYPIIEAVAKRHFASEFKRKQLPIKILRHEIVL